MVASASTRLLWVAVAAAATYFVCFPRRLEYPAHLLGGMGVAGVGFALLPWAARRLLAVEVRGLGALLLVAVATLVTELTVTGPADLMDGVTTILGGTLGVAAVTGAPRLGGSRRLAVSGAALVMVGLVIRYPLQGMAKHWWWFG